MAAPTYSLSLSRAQIREGQSVTITLTTDGSVASGTIIAYEIIGISAQDRIPFGLTGNFVLDGSGQAQVEFSALTDQQTEGIETLRLQLVNLGIFVSVDILDTSIAPSTLSPILFATNGHYYQAVENNVDWQTAFDAANAASYRGLQGYLVTITSADEDQFVHTQVIQASGITGWGSFAGYHGTWLGASDHTQEGAWTWRNGPEAGTVFANGITATSGNYANFYSHAYDGGGFNYLASQTPRADGTLIAGYINATFFDDLPANIGAAGSRYGDSEYGDGNGYVIEYGGLPATYSLTSSAASINEGNSVTFTVDTTNVEWGTSLPYSISGVGQSDITQSLTGKITVSQSGVDGRATLIVSTQSDASTEGPETLTLTVGGQSASVTLNDTSLTPAPTYALSSSVAKADEGTALTFTLSTTLLAAGTSVPYTFSSISDADIEYGLTGSFVIDQNGIGTLTRTIERDQTTEGTETLTLSIDGQGAQVQVQILDTSDEPQSLTPVLNPANGHYYQAVENNVDWQTAFDEANAASYRGLQGYLVTITSSDENTFVFGSVVRPSDITGYPYGLYYYYQSFWLGASDRVVDGEWRWVNGPETGNQFSLGSTVTQGAYSLISPVMYGTQVGQSYLIGSIAWRDGAIPADVVANTPYHREEARWWAEPSAQLAGYVIEYGGLPATYSLTSSATSINEGNSVTFTVDTTNVEWGTSLAYSFSGVDADDVIQGQALSGTVTVNQNGANGRASITLNTREDVTTEGTETITLTVGGQSSSVSLLDTSPTPVDISLTPTYAISSSLDTIDEGGASTVITINTTNVAWGTSIPYTITGVSADDLIFSLNGTTTLQQNGANGRATFSIRATEDYTTEGPETLTVTVGDQTKTITINDTSTAPPDYSGLTPTYSISSSRDTIDEGGASTVITINTTNVAWGTSIPYTITGVSAGDLIFSLNGTTTLQQNGANGRATFSIRATEDYTTEGPETLTVTVGDQTKTITINDTSTSPPDYTGLTPTYSISSSRDTIDEGGASTVITINTTNVAWGTSIPYTITGVSAGDLIFSLNGTTTLQQNGANGRATFSIRATEDYTTEGPETLTVTVGDQTKTITINDTSQGASPGVIPGVAPTYSVTASQAAINEGAAITFTVDTNSVAWGTEVDYSLSGIGLGDLIQGEALSGTFTVSQNGAAGRGVVTITSREDLTTEGPETLTFSIFGGTASVTLNDTSLTQNPTYALSAASSSVLEGNTATFTLTTTGVSAGTSVPYTITGVSATDLTSASLSGNATVDANGAATISIATAADQTAEDGETFTLTVGGASAQTLIADPTRFLSYLSGTYGTYTASGQSFGIVAQIEDGTAGQITLPAWLTVRDRGIGESDNQLFTVNAGVLSLLTTADIDAPNDLQIVRAPGVEDSPSGDGYYLLEVFDDSNQQGGRVAIKLIPSTVPTYALSSSSASVNEGGSVTFTLTTTNLPAGTQVAYAVSGISAADLDDPAQLNGQFTVGQNGQATVTLTLDEDATTEGAETLTLNAQGLNSVVTVNDTSLTPPPPATYSLSGPANSVDEGDPIRFSISTTNVPIGTALAYTITGITGADLLQASAITGSFEPVDANGLATLTLTTLTDQLTEGTETLTLTVQGISAQVTLRDSSVAVQTYTPVQWSGNGHYYQAIEQNLSWAQAQTQASAASYRGLYGHLVAINSQSESDFLSSLINTTGITGEGSLTGHQSIWLGASDSQAEGSWRWEGDNASLAVSLYSFTNGASEDYLVMRVPRSASSVPAGQVNAPHWVASANTAGQGAAYGGGNGSVIEYGSFAPSYTLSASTLTANEGDSITFTLFTRNLEWGTTLPFTVTGLTSSDLSAGALSGSVTLASNADDGIATVSLTLAEDLTTEGPETLTLTIAGQSLSVTVADTSPTPPPTYALTPASASIAEGGQAIYFLQTTYLPAGSLVSYALSATGGVGSQDLLGANLSGSVAIDANGRATLVFATREDLFTEGDETLTLTINPQTSQDATASILLRDTSLTPDPVYSLSSSGVSVNEGSNAVFTLQTQYVDPGTVLPYTLSGSITSADLTGAALTGSLTVNAQGQASLTLPVAADLKTEGLEVMTLTVESASSSLFVNDTSVQLTLGTIPNIPSYAVIPASASVTEGSVASFLIGTRHVPIGSVLDYTVSGIDASDLASGSLSGQITLDANGQAVVRVDLAADQKTEGDERLQLTVRDQTASLWVEDSSQAPFATYFLDAPTQPPEEGGIARFVLRTSQVPSGSSVFYSIAGLQDADIENGQRTGSVVIGPDGRADILVNLNADALTEGDELLILTAAQQEVRVPVIDSSQTPKAELLAYSESLSVAEGQTLRFSVTSQHLAPGTTLSYALTGIEADDLSGGTLTGSLTLDSNGKASALFQLASDQKTEGQEIVVFTLQGKDAQGQNLYAQSEGVKVQDLSVAPAAAASAPPAAAGGTGPAPSARKVISLGTQPAVVVNEPASAIVLTQNATTQSWQMTLDGKTETLQGVTRIATQDYVIGLDLEAASGQAYRIYRAIFDRSPDLEGLGYWIGRMDAGLSVEELAARFIDSDEYRSLYGTGLSPEAFLKRVYENVLGRAPDPAGLAWWVNQMQTNPDKTPAKVLADFSESAENKTGTSAELAQGVKYIAFGSKPAQPTAQDQLLALSPSVNEGGTARFEFKPAQPVTGSTYSYTIQGVSAADLASGSLTGSVVINEQGVGEIAIALLADKTTEGNELLGVRLGDLSADLTVYDTSLTVRVVGLVPGGG